MNEKVLLFDKGQGLYVGTHTKMTADGLPPKTVESGEFVFPPFCSLKDRKRAYEFSSLEEAKKTKFFLETHVSPLLQLMVITEKKKEKPDEV